MYISIEIDYFKANVEMVASALITRLELVLSSEQANTYMSILRSNISIGNFL